MQILESAGAAWARRHRGAEKVVRFLARWHGRVYKLLREYADDPEAFIFNLSGDHHV